MENKNAKEKMSWNEKLQRMKHYFLPLFSCTTNLGLVVKHDCNTERDINVNVL